MVLIKDLNAFKSIEKTILGFYEDIEILRFLSLNKKINGETKNSIGVDDQKFKFIRKFSK